MGRGLTIGSIIYWAKEDDPDAYRRWKETLVDRTLMLLDASLSMNIADFVRMELPVDLMYVSDDKWHYFSEHIWTELECEAALDKLIFPRLGDLVGKYVPTYEEPEETEEDERPRPRGKREKSMREKVEDTKHTVQSIRYYKGQLKPALKLAYLAANHGKVSFNMNRNLFACANGVWDFNEMVFRPGRQTDYISIKSPVEYKEPTPQERREFDHIMETLFPNKKLREYVLDNVAELLIGGNYRKTMLFFLGHAHAGKTVFTRMISDMLGPDYATTLPISLLTSKRVGQGQATPELTKLSNGLRFFTMNEPDPCDTLKIGTLKELTGDDQIYVRALYGNGKTTQPMCKFAYVSNYLPKIQGVDEATAARVRVINFESRFVHASECKKTYAEQLARKKFPAILDIKEKTKSLSHVFLWTSVERIQRMREEGRLFNDEKIPKCVMVSSKDFILDNDCVQLFVQTIEFGVGEDPVGEDEIYSRFGIWFKREHADSVKAGLSKRDLMARLEKMTPFRRAFIKPELPGLPRSWNIRFKS